jgi:hypothetical protein
VRQKFIDIFKLMLMRKYFLMSVVHVLLGVNAHAQYIYGDIVINEMMSDPTPVVALPDQEFVEIFNTTNATINLGGWRISDRTSIVTLKPYDLPPGGFLLLCSNRDTSLFRVFGPTMGVGTLPSLNNSDDDISLFDPAGNLIDFLAYTTSFYQDPAKRDGGWTLERINPFVNCSGLNNWRASINPSGGTPGTQNSLFNASTANFIPVLQSVSVLNANTIVVRYNDAMDPNDPGAAYILDGGTILSVTNATQRTADTIIIDGVIDPGTVYNLSISGRINCAELALPDTTILIALGVEGGFLDVVITEIQADPTPVVGLPDAEFIEIFNRTEKPISLFGWDLEDGNGRVTLGNIVLLPYTYLAFTTTSAAPLFNNPKVIGMSGFPGLTNAGEPLALYNSSGELVHSLVYSDSWHTNSLKKDGGWTLEMVDTDNPCLEAGNWTSSVDLSGGTPGRTNSVAGTISDNTPPALIEVQVEDASTIVAFFSEKLNPESLNGATFTVNNGIGILTIFQLLAPALTSIRFTLPAPMQAGTIYTLKVDNIFDCTGNEIGFSDTARFAIPVEPQPGDLLINEVLFNTKTGGFDFVELYNHSNKTISSKSLILLEYDLNNDDILEFANMSATNKLIFPGGYLVITRNPGVVQQQYFCPFPKNFLAVSNTPNWPDSRGRVALERVSDLIRLDELSYDANWHYKLLDTKTGVSLERISPDLPTRDQTNWHSAAQTVGFATPGYLNSAYLNPQTTDKFSLIPSVFSPDQDGFEDLMAIQYALDKPGYITNIYIFDVEGRRIRHLAKNELLAQEGSFIWDGLDDAGLRARIGIYIVIMEATDIKEGKVKRFKEKCVVAARWN